MLSAKEYLNSMNIRQNELLDDIDRLIRECQVEIDEEEHIRTVELANRLYVKNNSASVIISCIDKRIYTAKTRIVLYEHLSVLINANGNDTLAVNKAELALTIALINDKEIDIVEEIKKLRG